MFRIGGSAGTGITSGLDKPRTNYQFGGGADARRFIHIYEEIIFSFNNVFGCGIGVCGVESKYSFNYCR